MEGAKRISNLMADLLKFTFKSYLPIYVKRIISFIGTLIGEQGSDYYGVHITYSDPIIITKDNNSDRLGSCLE